MATLTPNSFTSYSLTDEELLAAQNLTELQKMNLQNKLCEYSELILAMRFDPNTPGDFMQNNAALVGKCDLLKELLEDSTNAQLAILTGQSSQQ